MTSGSRTAFISTTRRSARSLRRVPASRTVPRATCDSAQGREDAATALSARDAWRLATAGGAACLGRDDCGALAAGKCADVALFRLDDLGHAGMGDPLS